LPRLLQEAPALILTWACPRSKSPNRRRCLWLRTPVQQQWRLWCSGCPAAVRRICRASD
jgi:hypothetical protein